MIMRLLRPVERRTARFLREEDGGLVLAEFLILLPLLVWTYLALVLYWDAFRTINNAQKASYAVAEAISREGNVSTAYLNGMEKVMKLLVPEAPSLRMRITSFQWDDTKKVYVVLFSRSPGNRLPALTAADLASRAHRIPVMADKASAVLLETEVGYNPALDVGAFGLGQSIGKKTFDNFIITRPRYARRICLEGGGVCPANM